MLIEFSVSNFRSFKDKVTLSMVASAMTEHRETHTQQLEGQLPLLKAAVIYGPNASGKSNFIKAFGAMREIVIASSKSQRGEKIATSPYLFDKTTQESPSEFEVIFVKNGVRYQYGFTATTERVHEEWLFAYPKGRAQRWFTRIYDLSSSKYTTSYSEKLVGPKQLWTEATRDNSLFLSTAVQLNSSQLAPIYDWFDSGTRVVGVDVNFPQFTASLCKGSGTKSAITRMLQAADFDIQEIEVSETKFDHAMGKDLPEEVRKELEGRTFYDVKTVHSVEGGTTVRLDIEEESDGTQKFFGLVGPWLDIMATGKVVFIDELHEKLHPQMVHLLVSLFNNQDTNPYGAQIIFSTHDTTILDQKHLRRDQVWFVAKKSDKSSKLYPLTTFSPRKDHEDLAKNYLSGRYGALPYFKNVAEALGAGIGL